MPLFQNSTLEGKLGENVQRTEEILEGRAAGKHKEQAMGVAEMHKERRRF